MSADELVRHTFHEVYGRCAVDGPHPRSACAMFADPETERRAAITKRRADYRWMRRQLERRRERSEA